MKTMRSMFVQQNVSYREVGRELRERMEDLNALGYSIKDVIETVACNNVHDKQGFIVVYECDVPDAHEDEPDDNKSESDKWVNREMTFCFKNRDQAIEFIDNLREIIRLVGHVTMSQAFKLRFTIVKKQVMFDNVSDIHLIGWTDLSCMVDKDGSYDNSIIEAFVPMHYCTVTLPESKYLTEE